MPLPLTVDGYEPEWILLAQELFEKQETVWPIGNDKVAKAVRFRFYGFRKAFKKHDPENPWVAPLMETRATITREGHLHFARNPYSELIKSFTSGKTFQGIANPSHVSMDPSHSLEERKEGESSTPTHDATIMDILKRDKGE